MEGRGEWGEGGRVKIYLGGRLHPFPHFPANFISPVFGNEENESCMVIFHHRRVVIPKRQFVTGLNHEVIVTANVLDIVAHSSNHRCKHI